MPLGQFFRRCTRDWTLGKGSILPQVGDKFLPILASIVFFFTAWVFIGLIDGVHKKMDGIRATFLWQGADGKFKSTTWLSGK